jgi:signal recognition particle GTPase
MAALIFSMFGLFKKFKEGLAKTVSAIAAKTAAIFGAKPIDASSLETLEEALYTADFGVETTEEILTEIKAAYKKDKSCMGRRRRRSARRCSSACWPERRGRWTRKRRRRIRS